MKNINFGYVAVGLAILALIAWAGEDGVKAILAFFDAIDLDN